MKKTISLLIITLIYNTAISQDMNNASLNEIITAVSDSIQGNNGRWQFSIKNTPFICITDPANNRMRIISPIVESNKLDDELKTNALAANFHTALDVKYAISEGILWSVFIHPLKELTKLQVEDAISQVFFANRTFGTIYTSTNLTFGGNNGENSNAPIEKQEEEIKKERF